MQKVGKLVTCERCGRTIFLEDEVPMYTSKDIGEECKYGASNEEWKSWHKVIGGELLSVNDAIDITNPPEPKDLCPECAAHYERMMGYFWGGAKLDPMEDIWKVRFIKADCTHVNNPPKHEELIKGISRAFEDITAKNEESTKVEYDVSGMMETRREPLDPNPIVFNGEIE